MKTKPLGALLLDLEQLLDSMVDQHDLQWGDVLALVHAYLCVHRPDAREQYETGEHPMYYYGPSSKN